MARILLLDVDSPDRALLRSALRLAGHGVVDSRNAEEAIALASREPFDLILVDLFPPDMDGLEMLKVLSLVTGQGGTPIVTMADAELPLDLVRTAEAGAMDHLRKPFGFGDLGATVARFVNVDRERVDDLRVVRKNAAEVYRSSLELIETARSK